MCYFGSAIGIKATAALRAPIGINPNFSGAEKRAPFLRSYSRPEAGLFKWLKYAS